MSDFTNLTGRYRLHKDGLLDTSASRVSKRPRESQVCNPCRRSKLRCDRGQPCSSCIKRHDEESCIYQQAEASKAGSSRQNAAESRLMHLEALVKQLMQDQRQPDIRGSASGVLTSPKRAVPDPGVSLGQGVAEDAKYVGSTHWSAILDDIEELKAAVSSSSASQDRERLFALEEPHIGGEVIFGSSANYSKEYILAQYLLPKLEMDRLLTIYFQGETFIIPFLHSSQFQREYEEFCAAPSSANPLWLSILFSISCIASLMKGALPQSSDSDLVAQSAAFHTAAGQCLVLGGYHRPQLYVVEALGIYAQCKNLKTLDPSREAGIILGLAVRLAYEMGYHRDPDSFGSSTVFEGEMRRRLWSACKQMDLMISFQLGLPSNVVSENCDTKTPRNLLDSDFDVDTQVLPPSRSEKEATKLLWFIAKDRQMASFSKVCRDALSFREKSDAEVLELDTEIRQMHDMTPEILRVRPFSESIADSPFLIMTRLYIEFIYLKSLCILHRKYMVRGNASSTKVCVEAGREIVSHFIEMYREFGVGGRLYNERWMLTNFTMNDFVLGVMILCLVVHLRRKRGSQSFEVDAPTEKEIISLLKQSHTICVEKSSASRDARRVGQAVLLIINAASSAIASEPAWTPVTASVLPNATLRVDESSFNALSLSTEAQSSFAESDHLSFGTLDPFSFMGNDFDDMDWAFFDPQFQNNQD